MKIIITILVVLLGLGGGAYYAQDSGLYNFNQLKQYIPSQVKELLDIKDTETVSISLNELEDLEVQPLNIPEQQQVFEDASQDNSPFDNGDFSQDIYAGQENQQLIAPVEKEGENSMIGSPNVDLLDTTATKFNDKLNTQQQLAMNTVKSAQASVENIMPQLSNRIKIEELDASPEEVKMVKELNKIESKIVKLDNENEVLQEKYSQMLKANRELALKIRDIDIKIKTIDDKKSPQAMY